MRVVMLSHVHTDETFAFRGSVSLLKTDASMSVQVVFVECAS